MKQRLVRIINVDFFQLKNNISLGTTVYEIDISKRHLSPQSSVSHLLKLGTKNEL